MNFKLKSLEFIPSHSEGWESEQLLFGDRVTFVQGENGAGKTPVLAGVAFCLGLPHRFRKDVIENCASIHLEVEIDHKSYQFERLIDAPQTITALTHDGEVIIFDSEKTFSNFLFEKLKFPHPELTNGGNERAPLYLSHVITAFYIDQLQGWITPYWPAVKYIKDQREEVLRLILGITPRNPFARRDDLNKAKKSLLSANQEISDRRRVGDEVRAAFNSPDSAELPKLIRRRSEIQESLENLRKQMPGKDTTLAAIDAEINNQRRLLSDAVNQVHVNRSKISGLEQLEAEIKAESETLALNDAALNRFRSFCQAPNCGIFLSSERSYGRTLLYLLDQIKDLKVTIGSLRNLEKQSELECEGIRAVIETLNKRKTSLIEESSFAEMMSIIASGSSELIEVEMKISASQRLAEQSELLSNLYIKRDALENDIVELKVDSSRVPTTDKRTMLAEFVNKWLGILGFDSSAAPARFDENFRLFIGDELYSAIKGSTLTRTILAYHAAVLEMSYAHGLNHFGFIILDCPKQQELQISDLDAYLKELAILAGSFSPPAQICFSSSEFEFPLTSQDREWVPKYFDGKLNRYLIPAGKDKETL
jgi:hypothetical protein